ncbi:Cyclase family protein, putative [Theobroma cacao]|uniref:Cyclase family protein, putative n=1 Tax=Theobroma cacao TaxID=3641 RepID=A0A061E041_THECC|nr:Cyclase family protein, putative [Theobroma cacao]
MVTMATTMNKHNLLLLLCAGILTVNILSGSAVAYGNGKIFDITHKITSELPTFESQKGLGQFIWLVSSIRNGSIANVSQFKLGTHTGTHVDAPSHFFQKYYEEGFDVTTLSLQTLNGPALVVDVPRDKNITVCLTGGGLRWLGFTFDWQEKETGTLVMFPCLTDFFCGLVIGVFVYQYGIRGLRLCSFQPLTLLSEVMKSLNIPRGVHRVLFRTLNTDRGLMHKTEFASNFTGFRKDGAQWLVDNTDIKLVGLCASVPQFLLFSSGLMGLDYLSVSAYVDAAPTHHIFLKKREIVLVEGLNLDGIQPGKYTVHCLPLRMVGADGCPTRCILTA